MNSSYICMYRCCHLLSLWCLSQVRNRKMYIAFIPLAVLWKKERIPSNCYCVSIYISLILTPSVRHVPHTLLPFLGRHTCCKTHIIVESFELVLSLSYNTNIKAWTNNLFLRFGKNSCDNMTVILIWFEHGDRSETGSSVVSSVVSR